MGPGINKLGTYNCFWPFFDVVAIMDPRGIYYLGITGLGTGFACSGLASGSERVQHYSSCSRHLVVFTALPFFFCTHFLPS